MRFVKMYTGRHDILLIDGFGEAVDPADVTVQYLCDRHVGVGADTLMIAGPSAVADVRIEVYKANGNPVTLCGDAVLCAAKFMYDNGYVNQTAITVDTKDGVKQTLVTPSQSAEAYGATVDIGRPRFITPPIYNPYLGLECVTLGDNYLVMEDKKLDSAPVDTLGKKLASDPSIDSGIDVGFVSASNHKVLTLRVWKRDGAEARSDGTAAAAAAAVMIRRERCDRSVTVRMEGGDVSVTCDDDNHLLLTAPVCFAFRGEI